MAVTTKTAVDIIKGAFKVLGIYREDTNLTGEQVQEGLYYLNALIDQYAANYVFIPYDTEIEFPIVTGQRVYTISDQVTADVAEKRFAEIKYVKIREDNIEYPVQIEQDDILYKFRRDVDVTRRPTRVVFQNEVGKSVITFFNNPDRNYVCIIKGKAILDHLDLFTPITSLPIFYYLFFEYALGRLLKSRYPGATFDQAAEATYQDFKNDIESYDDDNIQIVPDPLFTHGRRVYKENALMVN